MLPTIPPFPLHDSTLSADNAIEGIVLITSLMSDSNQPNRLRELQEQVAREKNISPQTLRRLLAKVDEYSESHRAFGLPDDLLNILTGDLSPNPNPEPERTEAESSPSPPREERAEVRRSLVYI